MKRKSVPIVLLALTLMSSCRNGSDKSPEQMKNMAFKADSLEIVNRSRTVFAMTCMLISRGDSIIENNRKEALNIAKASSLTDEQVHRLVDNNIDKNKTAIQMEADKLGVGKIYSGQTGALLGDEPLPWDMNLYDGVPKQNIDKLAQLYAKSYEVIKKYAYCLRYDNFRYPHSEGIQSDIEEVKQMIKNHN